MTGPFPAELHLSSPPERHHHHQPQTPNRPSSTSQASATGSVRNQTAGPVAEARHEDYGGSSSSSTSSVSNRSSRPRFQWLRRLVMKRGAGKVGHTAVWPYEQYLPAMQEVAAVANPPLQFSFLSPPVPAKQATLLQHPPAAPILTEASKAHTGAARSVPQGKAVLSRDTSYYSPSGTYNTSNEPLVLSSFAGLCRTFLKLSCSPK
jgi:hypothetical protein